jgi:hypothetical protein
MFAAAAVILVTGLVAAHRGWLNDGDDDLDPAGSAVLAPSRKVRRRSSASRTHQSLRSIRISPDI